MQAVFAAIEQVAKADTTVLITGETGTGEELVTRSVYRASARADRPDPTQPEGGKAPVSPPAPFSRGGNSPRLR